MTHPRTAVTAPDAPAPAHTFSQGVRRGPLLQVSGQGPVDPATNEYLHPGDVAAQTTRTLRNVEAVLRAGGATFDDVVKVTVFVTDPELIPLWREARDAFFDGYAPASTLLVVAGLADPRFQVEVEAEAAD